jgi:hypothetical protein
MAGFCGNCGAPVLGSFCTQCGAKNAGPGAPLQSMPAPPPAPVQAATAQPVQMNSPVAVQAPPAPQPAQVIQMAPPIVPQPARSSGWGKVLLAVLIVFLVIGLGVVGVSVYGYYWAKHKITSYASAITNGASGEMKVVPSGDSCKLLSVTELQQVLGVPIEKSAEVVEGSDAGCAYYTNPTALAKLQKLANEQTRRQTAALSKNLGPNSQAPVALLDKTNQLEGIVKGLGLSNTDSAGKVFSFTIQRNFGSDSWSGMRLVESAVPGFQDVSGVGDHAMIGALGHAFYTVKGDTMIHMDTSLVPDVRTRGARLGKTILGRLQDN